MSGPLNNNMRICDKFLSELSALINKTKSIHNFCTEFILIVPGPISPTIFLRIIFADFIFSQHHITEMNLAADTFEIFCFQVFDLKEVSLLQFVFLYVFTSSKLHIVHHELRLCVGHLAKIQHVAFFVCLKRYIVILQSSDGELSKFDESRRK